MVGLPVPFKRLHDPENMLKLVHSNQTTYMTTSTAHYAKALSINTNTTPLDLHITTARMLQIIKSNRKGINLTDIVRTDYPDFDFKNMSKDLFKKAIDPLLGSATQPALVIRQQKNARVVTYFPKKASKRVIFADFIKEIMA